MYQRLKFPNSMEQITVQDFSYYHHYRDPVKGVSLNIRAGQITCLLGGHRCGKSTIINLLARRYPYLKGSICVDGQELNSLDKQSWLEEVEVIPQKDDYPYETVRQSIAGKNYGTDEEANVKASCEIYGLDQYFIEMEKGYETLIGDGSVPLSQAQSQLIAVAGALYQAPELLILDEATSAMDHKMEQHVLDILHRIKNYMIILLVTERPRIAYRSDYVYMLEGGQITKEGDPEAIAETLENLI